MHSLQQLLGIAVPNLCIIVKKRVKRQNLNTASVLLTYVENALEEHNKRSEEVGFEPTVHEVDFCFQDRRIRPLCHSSAI